jgi:hypothetical protein
MDAGFIGRPVTVKTEVAAAMYSWRRWLSKERDVYQAVGFVRRRGRRRRDGRYRGSGDGEEGSKSGGGPWSLSCPPSLWSKQVGESGRDGGESAQASAREPGREKERKGWMRTRDRVRSLPAACSELLALS